MIYVEGFRHACLRACRALYRGGRWLVIDLPAWLVKIPLIHAMLASPIYRFAGRFIVKPLIFTVLILAAFRSLSQTTAAATTNGAGIFFLVNLLLNSRLGRNAEEVITDWIVHNWDRFRLRVLGAVVQMVMEFFNRVLDAVDRFLYSVDEWLRFRSGQGRTAIVIKSAPGSCMVLRDLRSAVLHHAADRATSQPCEALSGGNGFAQDSLFDGVHSRSTWLDRAAVKAGDRCLVAAEAI